MKTIVCYGDSNTWGSLSVHERPAIAANIRYPWDVRWTGRLQKALGEAYHICEAGVCGRTTMFDCPMEDHRNGLADIDCCMMTHMPVDLVIITLGTNDVKDFIDKPPYVIAHGIERLVNRIRIGGYGPDGNAPEIIVVAPIRLNPSIQDGWLNEEFGAGALAKDAQLGAYYAQTAAALGAHFVNAGARIVADEPDGVHMSAEGHKLFAEMMVEKIRAIYGE